MFGRIEGISPEIDSCGGLIAKKTTETYSRIASHHRRWIDPEDLLQEALLAALSAQRTYKAGQGAKFSTYLYQGLDWVLSRYCVMLKQQKRGLTSLVEVDAPISEDNAATLQLPDPEFEHDQARADCSDAFVTLCRAVGDPCKAVLIRGLLLGRARPVPVAVGQELRAVARRLGIDINTFQVILTNSALQKKILQRVSSEVILSMGTEEGIRCLECTECSGQFSLSAVREKRFFVTVMTCRACLRKLQAAASGVSCFGKDYKASDTECRIHCNDKTICRQFKEQDMSDELDDVDLEGVDEKVTEMKKKKAAPAKKAAAKAAPKKAGKKPAAKAKAAAKPKAEKKPKVEEDPAPKEVGAWPFKQNSCMLHVFKEMLRGVSKTALEKEITEGGQSWPLMYKIMTSATGSGPLARKYHTWKVNEEGGRYKIYDIKYKGPKKAATAAA